MLVFSRWGEMALRLSTEQSELAMVRSLITRYGQEHLLDYLNALDKDEQSDLIEQISGIDFELMERLNGRRRADWDPSALLLPSGRRGNTRSY